MNKLFLIFLIALSNYQLFAQDNDNNDDWKFSGTAFIIPYLDARDFSNETHPDYFTPMKLRFGVEKAFKDIEFKVQIQDSRVWGQGNAFVANIKNLDLFQGYVQFNNVLNNPLAIQIGRFQMQYADERYIGRSPWNFIERAFDGVRFKYHTEAMEWDVFGTQTRNSNGYRLPAKPSGMYDYPAEPYQGRLFYGTWYKNKYFDKLNFHIFAYGEYDGAHSNEVDINKNDLNRYTVGAVYEGNYGDLNVTLEGAYQFGDMNIVTILQDPVYYNKDISAYLFSAYGSYKFDPVTVTLGTDWHSGTDPASNDYGTFDNGPGSKHKFFGNMDYFTDVPVQTMGYGVNDFYLKTTTQLADDWQLSIDGYYYMANQEPPFGETSFGTEFNVGVKYLYTKNIWIQWMNGLFLPGDLMKTVWNNDFTDQLRVDPGFASYIWIVVNL